MSFLRKLLPIWCVLNWKPCKKVFMEHFGGLKAALAEIAEEFAGIEIGSNTPPAVLNNLLTRYPKTQEPKG
jgi:hypothetical protein